VSKYAGLTVTCGLIKAIVCQQVGFAARAATLEKVYLRPSHRLASAADDQFRKPTKVELICQKTIRLPSSSCSNTYPRKTTRQKTRKAKRRQAATWTQSLHSTNSLLGFDKTIQTPRS